MKPSRLLIGVAATLWFVIFAPATAGFMNFWLQMVIATGILAGSALWLDREVLGEVYGFKASYLAWGVLSAVGLYGIFWMGDKVSAVVIANARLQIDSIYASRDAAPPAVIALLLLVWIGPAEEIFWRGHVQRWLAAKNGDLQGLLVATAIYALVHVWALNVLLVGAALVGGLFWGAIYMRTKSVWPGLISHALWDVAIFVIWPIG